MDPDLQREVGEDYFAKQPFLLPTTTAFAFLQILQAQLPKTAPSSQITSATFYKPLTSKF